MMFSAVFERDQGGIGDARTTSSGRGTGRSAASGPVETVFDGGGR